MDRNSDIDQDRIEFEKLALIEQKRAIESDLRVLEEELSGLRENGEFAVDHAEDNEHDEGQDVGDVYPDMIVRQGQTRVLGQRTYRFSNLIIEKGGTLKVRGTSRSWCILHCDGDVKIHGMVEGFGIPRGSGPIEATTPNGTQIFHDFLNDARGGRGGRGGPAHHWRGPYADGGLGASGTSDFGGGGGGGAGATRVRRHNRPRAHPGNNAIGAVGGRPGILGYASGGDGGRANRYLNGALLYIHCTNFDGTGGTIELKGQPGQNGGAGDRGSYQRNGWFSAGAGGGGGGAPGGDGGVLIVQAQHLVAYPATDFSGGHGGRGGAGGPGSIPSGGAGENGESGVGGYADWDVFTKKYLADYGYLEDEDAPLRDALIRLQTTTGLTATGEADEATLEFMNAKRCGVPDVAPMTIGRWKDRSIKYRVINQSSDVSDEEVRTAFRTAFDAWQNACGLTFQEVSSGENLHIYFFTGRHTGGDRAHDFGSNTLAHAQYPPRSGRGKAYSHYNEAHEWSVDGSWGTYDLTYVAAHEIGHNLGLPHSDDRESVMYPTVSRYVMFSSLKQVDIDAIHALYPK